MTFFTASLETVLHRYFLMMAIIIGGFLSGYPILTVLAFPVFISAIAAISFGKKKDKAQVAKKPKDTKEIKMVNTLYNMHSADEYIYSKGIGSLYPRMFQISLHFE